MKKEPNEKRANEFRRACEFVRSLPEEERKERLSTFSKTRRKAFLFLLIGSVVVTLGGVALVCVTALLPALQATGWQTLFIVLSSVLTGILLICLAGSIYIWIKISPKQNDKEEKILSEYVISNLDEVYKEALERLAQNSEQASPIEGKKE